MSCTWTANKRKCTYSPLWRIKQTKRQLLFTEHSQGKKRSGGDRHSATACCLHFMTMIKWRLNESPFSNNSWKKMNILANQTERQRRECQPRHAATKRGQSHTFEINLDTLSLGSTSTRFVPSLDSILRICIQRIQTANQHNEWSLSQCNDTQDRDQNTNHDCVSGDQAKKSGLDTIPYYPAREIQQLAPTAKQGQVTFTNLPWTQQQYSKSGTFVSLFAVLCCLFFDTSSSYICS